MGLPKNSLQCAGMIAEVPDLTYFEQTSQELAEMADSCLSVTENEPLVLIGHSGSGKTLMLKLLADRLGLAFTQIDCMAHLNLNQLKTLLEKVIPEKTLMP